MVENLKLKLCGFISIILLYYVVADKSIFIYVSSLCLYNIFLSCFEGISLKEKLDMNKNAKYKIFIATLIVSASFSLLFLILGILIGDLFETLLGVVNTNFTFVMMGVSLLTCELKNISIDYYLNTSNNKKMSILFKYYHYIEIILFIINSLIFFRLVDIPLHIANGLLFLPSILLSLLLFMLILFVINYTEKKKIKDKNNIKINYKKDLKDIFVNNFSSKMISVVKNSYYYISVIVLYMILSFRYNYLISQISNIIIFIYFYGIYFINFLSDLITYIIELVNKKDDWLSKIYMIFDKMLSISIIIGVISPLICKVIFNSSDNAIYLMMIGIFGIFISLYNYTFKNISSEKIIYVSLVSGILTKLILIIPLVDSFYRTGYNLIYGDIVSTILGMFISFIINYIYLKIRDKKELHLEKILRILYENIILCIILVIIQFIIPVKEYGYFKSLILMIIYSFIGIWFLRFKKKNRG